MTWRMACRLYVVLAVLLSLGTAAQAYLYDAGAAPIPGQQVLATLIMAGLALTYVGAALHAAHRAGTPVF